MEWTIGKIMAIISFLFGIAVALYFIFRPKVVNKNIINDGNYMDDNRK